MDSFLLSLEIITPLVIFLCIGMLVRKMGWINEETIRRINLLIVKVFLPVLVFSNIYDSDIVAIWNTRIALFSLGSLILLFAVLMLVVPIIEKDNSKRGVMVQGIARSNYVIFGLPIILSIYGEQAGAAVALNVAVCVPIFNIISVVALTLFAPREQDEKINKRALAKKIVLDVLKNPMVIAPLLGFAISFLHLNYPPVIAGTLKSIAAVTTPLALIVLGSSFNFGQGKEIKKQLLIATVARLVVVPLIFGGLAILIGMRGEELIIVYIMLAAPTAVASFSMAQQLKGDFVLAGQIVVYTSLFSVLTIFLGVFVLSATGLL